MNNKTQQQQQKLARAFCSIRSARDLGQLLRVDYRQLMLLIKQPRYKTFTVPKKDGGERLIENPTPLLKKVQSQLNHYLQAIYYFEKSNASYGFIVGVLNDDDRRNILTNARKHINRPWLLNVDLKDFFHFVTMEQVAEVFQDAPFSFKGDLPDLLAQLTTFQGRLPMGAPTSPVLSNLACRKMDETLMLFAQENNWVYTRYADDLSFSAKVEITHLQITDLRQQITSFGFQINEKSSAFLHPTIPKSSLACWSLIKWTSHLNFYPCWKKKSHNSKTPSKCKMYRANSTPTGWSNSNSKYAASSILSDLYSDDAMTAISSSKIATTLPSTRQKTNSVRLAGAVFRIIVEIDARCQIPQK